MFRKNFLNFFPILHSLYSKSAHFDVKEAKFVKKWYFSTHDTKCFFQFFGGTTTSLNGIMSGILVSTPPPGGRTEFMKNKFLRDETDNTALQSENTTSGNKNTNFVTF